MRIIAGYLGGRQIHVPHGYKTHPMAEKIRGAMFNALGGINGLTVLDAFAGSGALSLEAISRGASSAIAIDNDRRAYQTLTKNVEELGIKDKVKAIHAGSASWSNNNTDKQFDLVFIAPPYSHLQLNLLNKLTLHVKENGLLVLDWPGHEEVPDFENFKVISNKSYGDAQLVFYRKIS